MENYNFECIIQDYNYNNNNNNNVYFPQTDKQAEAQKIKFIHKPKLFTITDARKIYDMTYQ